MINQSAQTQLTETAFITIVMHTNEQTTSIGRLFGCRDNWLEVGGLSEHIYTTLPSAPVHCQPVFEVKGIALIGVKGQTPVMQMSQKISHAKSYQLSELPELLGERERLLCVRS